MGVSSAKAKNGFNGIWHPKHAGAILDMLEKSRTVFAVAAKANELLAEAGALAAMRAAVCELRATVCSRKLLEGSSKVTSLLCQSITSAPVLRRLWCSTQRLSVFR